MAVAAAPLTGLRFSCNRHRFLQLPCHPPARKCIPLPPQRFAVKRWFWPSFSQRALIFRLPATGGSPQKGNTEEANQFEKESDLPVSSSSSQETLGERAGKGRTDEMMEKLKRYGIAGVLSYGLLNTAYYLVTFLVVWFYVAPAPSRLGYAAAVERFIKIMAMVWAGSQVTKLIRAGGALALAPIVDNGLSWFTAKFKFESKTKAFAVIVGFCFGLAVLLFVVLTLLCA